MDVISEKRIIKADQDEIEIRSVHIIQFFKDNKRRMLIGGVIGLIIGAIYAFSKPNIFTVEVTVMPELQSRGDGFGLSSFSPFGMDNNGALDSRPDLYPNVLESVPFAMSILKQRVYSKELKSTMTLQDYINRTSTSSILDKLMSLFTTGDTDENNKINKSDPQNISQAIQVTKGEDGLIKAVQGSVTAAYDKKSGVITVTAIETDPVVAATVANLSLKYLTNYITAYRTEKARRHVNFLSNQVREARREYERTQYAVSNYRDRNISLYLNTAKIEEQRLQADYLLKQAVYNDLERQLEQAKIKVDEDTPTFKTLQPPVIPLKKSGPKRTLIMLGCAVAGVIIILSIRLVRQIVLKKQYT